MAALYRDALKNEFLQYIYFLSGSDEFLLISDIGAFLRVISEDTFATILTAEFTSSYIQIASYRYRGRGHKQLDFVSYSDPKFTEDILAKILRELC